MPQIKKSVRKDLSFSVSPWQSKQATPQITKDQLYQEIQLPLKRKTSEQVTDITAEASQRPRASQRKGCASQWHRKKKVPAEEVSVLAEKPATDTTNDLNTAHESDSREEIDTSEADTTENSALQGTAVLALLPSGQISGHILDTNSNACFGFMAHQLTAERECTRDTEWRLLHVTIIDYKSSKEVNFAAERTAEDAATIQAPLQMHGEEEQLIAALQGHADPDIDIEFKFQCTTILANESADDFLLSFNPKLRGKDAVVNKGDVHISKLPFAQCCSRLHLQKSSNIAHMPADRAYDSDFDE